MTDNSSAWANAAEAWLQSKTRRSGSLHTATAYRRDYDQFFAFVAKEPWLVASADAQSWAAHLRAQGLANTTIRRKLAALSSFYTFVIQQYTFVNGAGEESLYNDANGRPRNNPFSPVDRPGRQDFQNSRPLNVAVVKRALRRINVESRAGARDYALITTYLYTGRRNQEIAMLRWADIEVDEERHRYYYTWRGKGGKARTDELPPPAYHAICHFTQVMEWPGRDGHYVFRPIYPDRGRNLPTVRADLPANRPMTSTNILQIIRRRFVHAGVDPADVTVHTLRHTAAALRYRDGKGQDVLEISEFLGHSHIGTTQVYLSKRHKPIDSGWPDVDQVLSS